MTSNTIYHIPVLLGECLEGLNIRPDGVYVDLTFGGGGHSRAIFEQLSEKGKLIAFDQDSDAAKNTWEAPNFHFVAANFAYFYNHLRMLGFPKVDGILADLGVSSHQFDAAARGFSIRENAPLDMRMNQAQTVSAFHVVNEATEERLQFIFRTYGELNNARALASTLVNQRQSKAITTTFELMDALRKFAPKFKDHKFFAQVFQAIRIEVNQELEVLQQLLLQTKEALHPEGRLVVMSYHSLEDRLVKNFLKHGSFDGTQEKDFYGNLIKPFSEVVRHPIVPNEEEIQRNSRARSAKLRIAKRN
jgi:16S rRNA (cytosine1402-N4)-methyltransferase